MANDDMFITDVEGKVLDSGLPRRLFQTGGIYDPLQTAKRIANNRGTAVILTQHVDDATLRLRVEPEVQS